MRPRKCHFSNLEAVVEIDLPENRIKKTPVSSQMQATYCIYDGTEIAPMQQCTHRQTAAEQYRLVEAIRRGELWESAAQADTYRSRVR